MGDLTKNFSLAEMTKSQTALRHGINNWPDDEEINNLTILAEMVLQPIRDNFSTAVQISSGFRCLELNRLLGSEDSSQHRKGQAADIEIWGLSNFNLASWIDQNLVFDQLILEFPDGTPSGGWVHVSFVQEMDENRMQTLTITRDRTIIGLE